MSAIAIATIAAAGATLVYLERQRMRRDAARRCVDRRSRGVVRWSQLLQAQHLPVADLPIRKLVASLEHAVLAGDEVWSYEHRLFSTSTGESPFRFRRGRVNAAKRRFHCALQSVRAAADDWLEAGGVGEPAVARHAVARVVDCVALESAPDLDFIDPAIDALENALANLYRRPPAAACSHPFR